MKKLLKPLVLALCLSAVATSYADAPQLGNASDVLWSKDAELSIGREAYEQMLKSGDIYESQNNLDYLNYLGHKIAAYADTRLGLRFYLTRSPSINAFATPGGYVGVNIGLILATDNEHELAGVLAHEIAHVSQEHIARSMLAAKDRRLANAAAIAASILLASQGGGDAGAASMMAAVAGETQSKINDIRRHEVEADRVGRRLMEKAGFDRLGMQTFFGKLYTPASLDSAPSYLLTHPLPQRRQADIDSLKLRSKNLTSRDEYYLFRARIRSEFLPQAEVSRLIAEAKQAPNAAERDAGIYLSALQAMKFGKIDQALADLNRMHTAMRHNRDVALMRATLLLLQGKNTQAQRIYEQLWQRYAGDSIVAYEYAQYLDQQGELQAAADVLAQPVDSGNPQVHWLYGEILGKLGQVAEQYRMLIRYHREQGDYELALTQAQIALKHPDLDWQSRAGFEAQEKELKRIVKLKKEME
ncbi:MAG: hypothetical protein CR957_00295 [Gammaproteobacteria bacterium]|nr:MAG: hypothetical protein CR957_00295 [Gammaproteobacteria bacterium]